MFDYDASFIVDRINDAEDDAPLVCDGCNGAGKHIDRWGSWQCWVCQGSGIVLLSGWLANAHTYPPSIRDHLLANMPAIYTNGGNHHAR